MIKIYSCLDLLIYMRNFFATSFKLVPSSINNNELFCIFIAINFMNIIIIW